MTSTTMAAPVPLSRDESGVLLGQTMGLVALAAGVFALGAYIGRDASGGWAWLWFITAFAALLALNVAAERPPQLAVGLTLGFGLLLGLAVAPTVGYYVGADPQAVWEAGGATALFIAGVGAAGYATRRDLSALLRYLLRALTALTSGPRRFSPRRSSSTCSTSSCCSSRFSAETSSSAMSEQTLHDNPRSIGAKCHGCSVAIRS